MQELLSPSNISCPSSAILYESPTKAVVLIDIPSSLSAPPRLVPRCPHQPLEAPYILSEPKTRTAFNQELLDIHNRLRASLLAALEEIRQHYKGSYYHHRVHGDNDDNTPGELDFHANIPFLLSPNTLEEPITLYGPTTAFSDISDILSVPIISHSLNWTALTLSHPHPPKTFRIPPNSSFLLSKFQSSTATFTALAEGLGQFHFILLDPPWPNRSAARSSAYETLSRLEIKNLIKIPVGRALVRPGDGGGKGGDDRGQDGLVGIWVTNKPKFRKYVLETLFPSWEVELAGEWVWLKITTAGEPMFHLESNMRKPYEVLLFGRRTRNKRKGRKQALDADHGVDMPVTIGDRSTIELPTVVPAKTILAVPDLHSRKPCIKGYYLPLAPLSYAHPAYRTHSALPSTILSSVRDIRPELD